MVLNKHLEKKAKDIVQGAEGVEGAKKIAEWADNHMKYTAYGMPPRCGKSLMMERQNDLNCCDSRVEELRKRGKQKLILKELMELKE